MGRVSTNAAGGSRRSVPPSVVVSARANPSPMPELRAPLTNRSKMLSRRSVGAPGPSSDTTTSTLRSCRRVEHRPRAVDERVVQQAAQRGEHVVTAYPHRYSWSDVRVQPTIRPPEKPCVRRATVGHQGGRIYGLRRRCVTAGTSQERGDNPVEPLHL